VVTAYGAEIYPTRIRSRGAGLVAGMTKAGGVLILAIVLGAATTPSLATTAAIGAVPLLVAIVIFMRTAPDTHQRTLEDITRGELENV
jgi:putative MFS transporter